MWKRFRPSMRETSLEFDLGTNDSAKLSAVREAYDVIGSLSFYFMSIGTAMFVRYF